MVTLCSTVKSFPYFSNKEKENSKKVNGIDFLQNPHMLN